jgi:Secretion system C-terminal sorting domain
MKKIVPMLLILAIISKSYAQQCDCYSVNKIWMPQNTKNEVHVNFSNTCGNQVYLQFYLIQEKDTIARFDRCVCGGISNKGTTTYILETNYTSLPPLNSLKVTFDFRCSSVKFNPSVFLPEFNIQPTFYPNPTNDLINIENIQSGTNLQLYNLQGIFLQEWIMKGEQTISLKKFPIGVYFIRYQIENQSFTYKIVKQ